MFFGRRTARKAHHGDHAVPHDLMIDQRGVPTHACLNCGCNVFNIQATFADYDISAWFLDATCSCCGSPLTAPCPADDPQAG
ncbi:MAG: hypothetical protein O2943_07130 [Actinomycetota bacterium]|nr:hypothetical protein [Actinomycetota bacterium]